MLEIQLADGSGRLDLYPNEKVSFVLQYNLFDFQFALGTKSWSFKLPKSPNNLKLLGHLDELFVVTEFYESVDVSINVLGSLWKTGVLYFLEEKETYFDVHFAGEMGLLKLLLQDVKLTDIDYPVTTGISNIYSHAEDTLTGGPSSYDYVFTEVSLPKRRNTANTMYIGINGYDIDVNSNWLGFKETQTGFPNHANAMVPFPYLFNVLNHCASELGINLAGDIFKIEELKKLVFFNTVALNDIDDNGLPENSYPTEIDIKNHLPNIKIADFLIEFAKLFNQVVIFDERSSTLNFYHREALLLSIPNETLKSKAYKEYSVFKERRTFNLGYDYNEEDVKVFQDQGIDQDILRGVDGPPKSEDVISKISTLPTWGKVTPISSLTLNEEVPLQFLIYRGFVQNPGINLDRELPASTGDLGYTPYTGNSLDQYSLLWTGTGNLYDTWWSNFLSALSLGRVIKLSLLMSYSDVLNFNPTQLYSLMHYVCLFEELNLIFNEGKIVAEGKALKL